MPSIYACEPEGETEFYVLDQELFVVLYYYYSYFIMGSCYLCYICTSLNNVLLLKFTPNCSYMQSHEVPPYLLNSVLRHLQLNSTTQHARHQKWDRLPPTNFSIFTLKNVTWRAYLISFTVQCCFLFHFVCIELLSLFWFLQIWVAIYVYGAMINKLVPLNKEINANVCRHSLWEYSKRFHCSFELHLTSHLTSCIETCIRWTPCIRWTLQHSPRVSA